MVESPVKLEKVDCGNGKRKVVVREREYDMVSWPGLKLIGTALVTVAGIVAAVLTAYYSAEAGQNAQISKCREGITTQQQRFVDRDKNLDDTFKRFDETLREQRKIIDETSKTVTRIDTQQTTLIKHVEKISNKLEGN